MFNLRQNFAIIAILVLNAVVFSQNPLLLETSIKFETSTTASLVGENGLIMRTTDNGISWTEQSTNISNTLFGNSISGTISLAAGENGVILRSSDNGANWDPILPGTLENLNDVEISGSNAVVCGNSGVIYYSDDAGINWYIVTSGTTRNLHDIKFISPSIGFITGEFGTLLKTTDGGTSWNVNNLSFTNAKLNAIEAIDEYNLVLVGDEGKILISNDGGESWYGPSGFLFESNLNDVVFFTATDGMIVGENNLMLRTNDGGYTWQQVVTSFSSDSYDFRSVSFSDNVNGITVGSNGVEVYTIDGGNTWSEAAPINSLQNNHGSRTLNRIELNQNYPNPFNPSTNIGYSLPFDANVSVKVYDIAGKEITSLFSGYQTAGSHSVHFDANNLSSGVYFYKLNVQNGANSFTKVNKMILTK